MRTTAELRLLLYTLPWEPQRNQLNPGLASLYWFSTELSLEFKAITSCKVNLPLCAALCTTIKKIYCLLGYCVRPKNNAWPWPWLQKSSWWSLSAIIFTCQDRNRDILLIDFIIHHGTIVLPELRMFSSVGRATALQAVGRNTCNTS